MALNDHFSLKSVSGSATNELVFLAFGENCSEICRATHRLSAAKKWSLHPYGAGDISVIGYSLVFLKEEASNQ